MGGNQALKSRERRRAVIERWKVYSRRWAVKALKRDLRRWTVNPRVRTRRSTSVAQFNVYLPSTPGENHQRFKAVRAVLGQAPVNRRSHIRSTSQLRSEVGYLYAEACTGKLWDVSLVLVANLERRWQPRRRRDRRECTWRCRRCSSHKSTTPIIATYGVRASSVRR